MFYAEFIEMPEASTYRVFRGNVEIGTVRVVPNKKSDTRKKFLMLLTDANVLAGDRLVSIVTDEDIFIDTVRKAEVFWELAGLDAFYHTAEDIAERQEKQSRGVAQQWSIGTNYGIVGNQGNANQTFYFDRVALDAEINRRGEDVEELHALVEHVDKLQAQPEISPGSLARFSDLMQKHSWMTQSILGALLTYLTSQPAH